MDILSFIFGFAFGRFFKKNLYINELFYLLLLLFVFFTAINAKDILNHQHLIPLIIKVILLSFGSTSFIFVFCLFVFPQNEVLQEKPVISTQVFKLFLSFSFVISSFILGGIVGKIEYISDDKVSLCLNASILLMCFFIGIIISKNCLLKIRFRDITLPIVAIVANLVFSLIVSMLWTESIVLLSGFGWCSLSSAMITKSISNTLGAEALLIDISRGLFALGYLLLCGRKKPLASIAASGVLSCDAFLPLVEKNCGEHYIPRAFSCGLFITFISPLYIQLALYLTKNLI